MQALSPVVYNDNQPVTLVGLTHPVNVVPLLSLAIVLVFASALFAFGASLVVDVLVVAGVSRVPVVRQRLHRYARKKARRRAAQHLRELERREWQELESLVERTPLLTRVGQEQLDHLLALYVNVGQALAVSSNTLDVSCTERPELLRRSLAADGNQPLTDIRIDCIRRATRAMDAVQRQLSRIAQLVHLGCEQAAVNHCEQAAGLWQTEVEEATLRARLETASLNATDPDLALLADA